MSIGRKLVRGALGRITEGRLTLVDGGERVSVGEASGAARLDIEIVVRDQAFYGALAFGGALGAAESYMDGAWECDDLAGLFELLLNNYEALRSVEGPLRAALAPLSRAAYWLQRNSRSGSRRNIAAHYDLSNEFFALWLDPTMTYSCGVFEDASTTLEAAQLAKIDMALGALEIGPGDHLLEIGTGWGSVAIRAARDYGCRVTTTTVSRRQYELAKARIEEAGVSGRVELLLTDYRDLTGSYDKVISIEMIEAVGLAYLDTYFGKVSSLLKPDGLALIQAITIRDQFWASAARTRDFLKKYIFPGSCLLSVEAMSRSVRASTDMRVLGLTDIGPHYAETLRRWLRTFDERIEEVRALGFDERFERMWRYYLTYCEGAMRARHCSDVQLLLGKPSARPVSGLAPFER